MPKTLKSAALSPLVKKKDVSHEELFPSFSNLKFVSKIIEKVLAWQLNNHILDMHLDVCIFTNYILTAVENNSLILLLLDLSAASCRLWHYSFRGEVNCARLAEVAHKVYRCE